MRKNIFTILIILILMPIAVFASDDAEAYLQSIAPNDEIMINAKWPTGDDQTWKATLYQYLNDIMGDNYANYNISCSSINNCTFAYDNQSKNINISYNDDYQDKTAPIIENVVFDKDEYIQGEELNVTFDVIDDSDIQYISASTCSSNICQGLRIDKETDHYTASFIIEDTFINGQFTIYFYAADVYQNDVNLQEIFNVNNQLVDDEFPVIDQVTTNTNDLNIGDTLDLSAKLTDNNIVSYAYAYINDINHKSYKQMDLEYDNSLETYAGNITIDNTFYKGINILTIVAIDQNNNSSYKKLILNINDGQENTDNLYIDDLQINKTELEENDTLEIVISLNDQENEYIINGYLNHEKGLSYNQLSFALEDDGKYHASLLIDDMYNGYYTLSLSDTHTNLNLYLNNIIKINSLKEFESNKPVIKSFNIEKNTYNKDEIIKIFVEAVDDTKIQYVSLDATNEFDQSINFSIDEITGDLYTFVASANGQAGHYNISVYVHDIYNNFVDKVYENTFFINTNNDTLVEDTLKDYIVDNNFIINIKDENINRYNELGFISQYVSSLLDSDSMLNDAFYVDDGNLLVFTITKCENDNCYLVKKEFNVIYDESNYNVSYLEDYQKMINEINTIGIENIIGTYDVDFIKNNTYLDNNYINTKINNITSKYGFNSISSSYSAGGSYLTFESNFKVYYIKDDFIYGIEDYHINGYGVIVLENENNLIANLKEKLNTDNIKILEDVEIDESDIDLIMKKFSNYKLLDNVYLYNDDAAFMVVIKNNEKQIDLKLNHDLITKNQELVITLNNIVNANNIYVYLSNDDLKTIKYKATKLFDGSYQVKMSIVDLPFSQYDVNVLVDSSLTTFADKLIIEETYIMNEDLFQLIGSNYQIIFHVADANLSLDEKTAILENYLYSIYNTYINDNNIIDISEYDGNTVTVSYGDNEYVQDITYDVIFIVDTIGDADKTAFNNLVSELNNNSITDDYGCNNFIIMDNDLVNFINNDNYDKHAWLYNSYMNKYFEKVNNIFQKYNFSYKYDDRSGMDDSVNLTLRSGGNLVIYKDNVYYKTYINKYGFIINNIVSVPSNITSQEGILNYLKYLFNTDTIDNVNSNEIDFNDEVYSFLKDEYSNLYDYIYKLSSNDNTYYLATIKDSSEIKNIDNNLLYFNEDGTLKNSLFDITNIEIDKDNSKTINTDFKETLTWQSSDENIVTVENGVIYAHASGKATITATTIEGYQSIVEVTVNNPIKGIDIIQNSITLEKDAVEIINVVITPSDTTCDQTLTWTSSDESIVTVTDGKITAIKPGTAVVTVKTVNGISDSIIVNVINSIKSIDVDTQNLSIACGEEKLINAVITPSDTTDEVTLTWTSSDESIVTVTDGKIIAIKPGTAVITVETVNGISATIEVTVLKNNVVINFDSENSQVSFTTASGSGELRIENITKQESENVEINNTEKVLALYNIYYVEGSNEAFINTEFTIRITVDKTLINNYKKFYIAYILDGKVKEKIPCKIVNNYFEFKVTHFSEYAIIGIEDSQENTIINEVNNVVTTNNINVVAPANASNKQVPNTQDNIMVYMLFEIISIISIAAIFITKKKYNK